MNEIDLPAGVNKALDALFAQRLAVLCGAGLSMASTNVDTLIETAGNMLFGQVGVGVSRAQVAGLPPTKSPLLKIHGCWTDPPGTVWAPGQVTVDPIRTRIEQNGVWLEQRLLNSDLIIVGYWTDWDYLNQVLETSLGAVSPSRVIVVDPCSTASFETKAPVLFAFGQRATGEFSHVRVSGDSFLRQLRIDFSRAFVRRVLQAGRLIYQEQAGVAPNNAWLEPSSSDAGVLWRIRRDLEGANPNEPAKSRVPIEEPLLGMTILQLQAAGAAADGSYWNLGGNRVRVLRTANRPLYEVEAAFSRETPPVVAPEYVIAVGAEAFPLPPSIARGSATGTIARGPRAEWLSRTDAIARLGL